jgi:choline dehydrogenase-like flavoprotein
MTSALGEPALTFVARAKAVFVCGGAIQTPALLLRSGLRSHSGNIGRNLSMHPNAMVAGVFDDPVEGWKGVHQAYQVREFVDRGMLFAAVNLPPGSWRPRYGPMALAWRRRWRPTRER